MFGGAGIFADGLMIALVVDGVIYLKADDSIVPLFEREGLAPFSYETKNGKRTLTSYWRMPERLYDEPDELARLGARMRWRGAPRRAQAAEGEDSRKRASGNGREGGAGQATLRSAAAGELRVGLADHPVAAVALGGIEAGVGALDQRLRGVALAQRSRRRARS